MNRPTIPAILATVVLIGYLALEAQGLGMLQGQLEPLAVFDRFAEANRAVALCGDPDTKRLERFRENYEVVTGRAVEALAEQQPGVAPEVIAEAVQARRRAREQEVEALVAERGCGAAEVRDMIRRFGVRARQRLHGP